MDLRKYRKSLISETVVYGMSGSLVSLISLINFPILARHFSVADFGILDLSLVFITFCGALFVMGQDSAILRYYFRSDVNHAKSSVVLQSFKIQILWAVLLIGLFFFLYLHLGMNIFSSSALNTYLPLLVLYAFGEIIASTVFVVLRIEAMVFRYVLFAIFRAALLLLVTLITVFLVNGSVSDYFHVYGFSFLMVSFVGVALLFPFLNGDWFSINLVQSKILIRYSVFLGAVVLIGASAPILERAVILDLVGSEALGFYAAAVKITVILVVPLTAFKTAFFPWLMRSFSEDEMAGAVSHSVRAVFFAASVFLILFNLASHWLLETLAGENYLSGGSLMFFVSVGIFFQALGVLMGIGTVLNHKTEYRLYINIISLLSSLVVMIWLVPLWGVNAVAIAFMFSHFLRLLLEVMVGQVLWPINWPFRLLLFWIIPVLSAAYFASLSQIDF